MDPDTGATLASAKPRVRRVSIMGERTFRTFEEPLLLAFALPGLFVPFICASFSKD